MTDLKKVYVAICGEKSDAFQVNYGIGYGKFWVPKTDIKITQYGDDDSVCGVLITDKQLARISK